MIQLLRSLTFGIAATLSAVAMAQYTIHVEGVIEDCTPTTTVTLQTEPGINPAQTVTLPVDDNCSYEYTFNLNCSYGGFIATLICGIDTSNVAGGSWIGNLPVELDMPVLGCSQACDPPTILEFGPFNVCSNDSLEFTTVAEGTAPFFYYWSGPGIFSSYITESHAEGTAVAGTYQVTVVNACGTADTSVSMTITPAPNPGWSTEVSICDINAPTDLLTLLNGTPDAGGTWSLYDGPSSDGTFDPETDDLGMYIYTVTGVGPCADNFAYVIVNPIPTWYDDTDGDGIGCEDITIQSCIQPPGYLETWWDHCPYIFGSIGSACDDGDPLTYNDLVDFNCECIGIEMLVDCLGIPGGTTFPGTSCDDGDPLTFGDVYQTDCTCSGAPPLPCWANFYTLQAYDSIGGSLEPIPDEVWLWNVSTGGSGGYEVQWDFGDGASSSEYYPTHYYDGPGPWLICLTLYSGGCIDTHCDSLSVDENGMINGMVLDGQHVATSADRSGGFTLNVIQQIPTGITETPAAAEMNIWPNPVDRELNITYTTTVPGVKVITVIDPGGRLVIDEKHAFTTGSNTLQLSTGFLEPGLYMVRIGNDAHSKAHRFIKVR